VVLGPWMRLAVERRAGVSLSGFLGEHAVSANLAAADRPGAIRTLSACLAADVGDELAERIAGAALAREQEFGTAVGCGVAIPHARLADLSGPVLAFGRAPRGIEWDAPDGAPVRHVFLLATPADARDTHAQILSQIARIMQTESNRARIDDAADSAALHQVLQQLFATARGSARPAPSPGAGGHA
jgi:mannitol/fructose-specific phosphotransferase system IIA component (Ntr-type)